MANQAKTVRDVLQFFGLHDRIRPGDEHTLIGGGVPPEVLLNAAEASAMLGIRGSTWALRKQQGWTKQFEASRPIGQRRYARVLVERYLRGELMSQYGRRRV